LKVRKVKRKPSAIERISKVIFGLTSLVVSDFLSSETRTEKTEKAKKDPNSIIEDVSGLTIKCKLAHVAIPKDIGCFIIFLIYVGI
jgi:hypothetical protein